MGFEGKTKVAIVGEVNAGKSSLIKYLTEDSSINVNPLPGETVTSKEYSYNDIILIDTPGLNDVNKSITRKTMRELKKFDHVVMLLNAAGNVLSKDEMALYRRLKRYKINVLIVINKIDKADSIESILRFVRRQTEHGNKIIAISTKTGEGIEQLKQALLDLKKVIN